MKCKDSSCLGKNIANLRYADKAFVMCTNKSFTKRISKKYKKIYYVGDLLDPSGTKLLPYARDRPAFVPF